MIFKLCFEVKQTCGFFQFCWKFIPVTCSCITNRAYPILGNVSVFNIKITFFGLAGGLAGSSMMYARNTNKVIFKTCWREVINTFKNK